MNGVFVHCVTRDSHVILLPTTRSSCPLAIIYEIIATQIITYILI